jgi:2-dehydro-3-deoxyphosphooctonate aldolase (KDO 8-P synthase)
LNVPIATDLHEVDDEAEPVAAVADIVQIPAFLCRPDRPRDGRRAQRLP